MTNWSRRPDLAIPADHPPGPPPAAGPDLGQADHPGQLPGAGMAGSGVRWPIEIALDAHRSGWGGNTHSNTLASAPRDGVSSDCEKNL